MTNLHVESEIASLRKVLLHKPGDELLNMTPSEAGEFLFDDIPYLSRARKEHDAFARLLKNNGVEVVYLIDLMAEVLQQNPEIVSAFLKRWMEEGHIHTAYWQQRLSDYLLADKDYRHLVAKTMSGVSLKEIGGPQAGSLEDMTADLAEMVVAPMPNLYFTRDPGAIIAGGLSLSTMHFPTRQRESIYLDYIHQYHPLFAAAPLWYQNHEAFSIEGGDILVLSAQTVAVGLSQRSEPDAVEHLAFRLLSSDKTAVKTVLAFTLPKVRAFMHLDTVMTQVDTDKFTIHAKVLDGLRCFALTLQAGRIRIEEQSGSLDRILAGYLGLEAVDLIVCGGDDDIAAQREQWNDGANTLALAPGRIVTYQRNEVTNRLLRRHGIEVLEIDSGELSRGRGGPHCMSMPLIRE